MRKVARIAIALGIIFATIPDWASGDEVIKPPTHLEIEVDQQAKVVKLAWEAPENSAPIERYAVFWFCKGCDGGRAVASMNTHIDLPFSTVDDAGALDGRMFQFSIRSDNDSLHLYSGFVAGDIYLNAAPITIVPAPSPTPTPSDTPTASASPTPSPTPTPSDTPTPTASPTPSLSPSPSAQAIGESATVTAQPSPQPSATIAPTPSPTPEPIPAAPPAPAPKPVPAPDVIAQRKAEAEAAAALLAAQEAEAAKAAAEAAAKEAEAAIVKAAEDARIADAKAAQALADALKAEAMAKAKADADALLAIAQAKADADRVAQEVAKAKAEADKQAAEVAKIAADAAAKAQADANAKAEADKAKAEADKVKAEEIKAKAEAEKAIADVGVKPNGTAQLPDDKPKLPESNLLTPRVQQDKAGVENGGIALFGTKTQPQVVGEDGVLTPPPPAPGSGDPIPPDAITIPETFIGQPGGMTFNAPDIAIPIPHIDINIDLPGVGEAAQAVADAYVAIANIGNDMSPITRKKAKKILVATIFAGAVMRRNP